MDTEGVRVAAIVPVLVDTEVEEGELVSVGLPACSSSTVWVNSETGDKLIPLRKNSLRAVDSYVRRRKVSRGPL